MLDCFSGLRRFVPVSHRTGLCFALLTAGLALLPSCGQAQSLLNVSYDPTRELYKEINKAFVEDWRAKTGQTITVRVSHGGSGAQARSVIDGVPADVVTLGIPSDIDAVARLTGKIPADWSKRLPNDSLPYTSTVVFVVRKGNPKGIKDWDDLTSGNVKVITANPKTSSGGRWNFLAAWGFAFHKTKDRSKADAFVADIYKNVPVLDTGARGSTITFAQRGLGDVLPAWENEAYLVLDEFGRDKFEVVVPQTSILAEPPVTIVDGNVDKDGNRKLAEAYLQFLYSDKGQAIIAKHHFRPFRPEAADKKDLALFPQVARYRIEPLLGTWPQIQKQYFDNGGVFDKFSAAAGH